MAGQEIVLRVNEDNPEPRVACAIVVDTSHSMSWENRGVTPIEELNKGLQLFQQDAKSNSLTAKSAEICVVTFGGRADLAVPFAEVRDLEIPHLAAGGGTPMGDALRIAVQQLEQRKHQYREAGIEYYRPWVIVMSDGMPTDGTVFEHAAQELRDLESRRALTVFPIGIGSKADMSALARTSNTRSPVPMREVSSFEPFFLWLSKSLTAVSGSGTQVQSDSELGGQTEQVPLPPVSGWTFA